MINTGSHKKLGDNDDYYAYSPGLYKEAAEWIVERGVKVIANAGVSRGTLTDEPDDLPAFNEQLVQALGG